MLNSFLSYLKSNGKSLEKYNGFDWSYGSQSHTQGIWMWNTPIDYHLNGQDVRNFFHTLNPEI